MSVDGGGLSAPGAGAQAIAPPRIEGFQVLELLGHGGMGVVWKAVQLSTRRTVAVKIMAGAAFAHPAARQRFGREVELASSLEHPHIARVYHSGLLQDACFYAMEFIDGRPLDRHVKAVRADQDDMLRLVRLVCLAVEHAHRRGVIHRDLKPSNILITADGQPHVLDFGLAKSVDAPAGQEPEVSLDGTAIGTLAYMSPEQAAGRGRDVDTRSDVYSLGVILFELLAGDLPHDAGGTRFEHQRRIIEQDPRRPRSLNPALDGELESLLCKALSRDPAGRYASAGELAEELRRYLDREPLAARPLTAGYFLRKWVARHRVAVAVAAGVLILLTGVGVYSFEKVRHERDRATVAAGQERLAKERERRVGYVSRVRLADSLLAQGDLRRAVVELDECPADLRHWEWRRLRHMADQSTAGFTAGNGTLVAASLGPDDGQIITAHTDGGVARWNLETGGRLSGFRLTGKPERVLFLNRGRTLAAFEAGVITLHDTRTGETLRRLDHADGPLTNPTASEDGPWLAAGQGGRVLAWNTDTDADPFTHVLTGGRSRLAVSGTGVVAAAMDEAVVVVDAATGRQIVRVPRSGVVGSQPALDRAGRWLAFEDDAGLQTVDLGSGRSRVVRPPGNGRAGRLALAGEAPRLIWSERDETVWLAEPGTDGPPAGFRGHFSSVCWLGMTGDDRPISADQNMVKRWDPTRTHDGVRLVESARSEPWLAVAVSAGGRAAIANGSGQLRLDPFQKTVGEIHDVNESAQQRINRLDWSADGRFVLVAGSDPLLARWDTQARTATPLINGFDGDGQATDTGCGLNGLWFCVVNGSNPRLVVGETDPGRVVKEWPGVQAAALSGDGLRLIVAEAGELAVYDTRTWNRIGRLPMHGAEAVRVATDQAGDRIAAETTGRAVRVWSGPDDRDPGELNPEGGIGISALAMSADGRRLFTGRAAVRVWDTQTLSLLLELSHPRISNVLDLSVPPNGRGIAACGPHAAAVYVSE